MAVPCPSTPRLSTFPATAAQELAALLRGLLSHERDVVTDFLVYLEEFDRRGFALALGYGSLFDYCTRGLGLSSSAAYRRITAARLLRRFPIMEPMLRDGRLSPTTVTMLKDVLEPGNQSDLRAVARGGETTVDNLLLACRRHNDWLARCEFGEAHVARCQRRRRAGPAPGDGPKCTAAGGSGERGAGPKAAPPR